jgi:hypothetical protein
METGRDLSSRLGASARAQEDALFFSMLPLEIRKLIYIEFWRLSALRQHVLMTGLDSTPMRLGSSSANIVHRHSPCLIDEHESDTRYANFLATKDDPSEGIKWLRRLKSDWARHWSCQEARNKAQSSKQSWTPFINVFLTCKRL